MSCWHIQFNKLISYTLQSQAAALRISGADANTYLQGQFTNDLSGESGVAVYGLWLNQKGRILADSTLLKLGPDEWLTFSASSSGESIMRRLTDYIIADEVEVANAGSEWRLLTLWGAKTETLCAAVGASPPPRGLFSRIGGGYALETRAPAPGAILLAVPVDKIEIVLARLRDVNAQEVSAERFTRERLRHWVPAVPQDLGWSDFPQEGGLEVEAVSFTKGCFLGQEVMARLKNRGQVRRRLEILQGAGAPPVSGTALFQASKKVGETRSATADEGGFLCFAMITLSGWDPGRPMTLTPDGPENIQRVRS